MTVAEWASFWNTVHVPELHTRYYYKNKQTFLYKLKEIKDNICSIKINVTCDTLTEDHIEIYSDHQLSYNQEKIYDLLRAKVPNGSFAFILNIYIN